MGVVAEGAVPERFSVDSALVTLLVCVVSVVAGFDEVGLGTVRPERLEKRSGLFAFAAVAPSRVAV